MGEAIRWIKKQFSGRAGFYPQIDADMSISGGWAEFAEVGIISRETLEKGA
jgi:hypothetical protein